MRAVVALAPLLVAGAYAALPELSISKRDAKGRTSQVAHGVVRKRDDGTLTTNVFDIASYSLGGAYYLNVTVGTPPQNQIVILDTGSSDLYFDASTSAPCQSHGDNSCRGGSYSLEKSSTYHEVLASPAFNTSFGDGSSALGPYGEDVVGIGDLLIDGIQFGVAEELNSTTGYALGLMGIGYSFNEAGNEEYPNIPEALKDAGVIASRLYSIYLNDVGEVTGTILFGGIDTSKYTGELVTLNLIPVPISNGEDGTVDLVFEFITEVTALSVSTSGKDTSIFSASSSNALSGSSSPGDPLPVLLDTGSAAWSVPQWVLSAFDAHDLFTYVDSQGLCSCSHRDDDDSLTLEFGGEIQITIPNREFIVPSYDPNTDEPVPYTDGTDTCAFMISEGDEKESGGFLTLGDAILRSMYIVFDLDNGQVSIAQAKVNSTDAPSIVTVGAGPSGIASAISSSYSPAAEPNSASIAEQVSATATFSVETASTTIGTATGTAAEPTDAIATDASSSSNSGSISGSGSGSATSSSAAASGISVPGIEWGTACSMGVTMLMAALGAAIIL